MKPTQSARQPARHPSALKSTVQLLRPIILRSSEQSGLLVAEPHLW